MTILATHLAIVLGGWRLRIRIDIDEPREADLTDERAAACHAPHHAAAAHAVPPQTATWGRG
ncbi:MAG: hypothetical protein JWM87_1272 [Candidatus Eremiobacteraeota bacterium]|nr:hypothetical protein [Candidatus Eremiobacteraeota bacterium]